MMLSVKIFFFKIGERLGAIFSELIFSHGFVHTDPHPGNVLINPVKSSNKSSSKKDQEFQIVLLDHGLYQVEKQLENKKSDELIL
jgi:aarF domain-containing kinase